MLANAEGELTIVRVYISDLDPRQSHFVEVEITCCEKSFVKSNISTGIYMNAEIKLVTRDS